MTAEFNRRKRTATADKLRTLKSERKKRVATDNKQGEILQDIIDKHVEGKRIMLKRCGIVLTMLLKEIVRKWQGFGAIKEHTRNSRAYLRQNKSTQTENYSPTKGLSCLTMNLKR